MLEPKEDRMDEQENEEMAGCVECGGEDGAQPHDPQCMTGRLESVENAAARLRRIIEGGSQYPFTEVAELLLRRMRACELELGSVLAADEHENARVRGEMSVREARLGLDAADDEHQRIEDERERNQRIEELNPGLSRQPNGGWIPR